MGDGVNRDELARGLLVETALAERRKNDPLRNWTPTRRQDPFIQSVLHGPPTENWFIAANRAGKSDALAYCIAHLARFGTPENPGRPTTGWVVSLDAPASRDIIQPKLFDNGFVPPGTTPFIPDREIAKDGWRVSDQILKLKHGSIIGFKSAESGRVKFQGAEKDYVAFDEEQQRLIYEESVIRVGAGRKLRIFGAATLLPPEGIVGGVTWMYPDVIQPWENDEPGIRARIGLFGASIYDNPHVNTAEIERLEAIYPEGTPQRRIRLGGEWLPGLAGARAYASFTRSLHVRPQPPQAERRPLLWSWDFNVEPLCSLVAQREGNLYRILRELVIDEGSIPEMCDWFRREFPSHSAEVWVYGDATGKGRTGQTGQSDYTIMMNAMRQYGPPLKLKVPAVNPLVKDRVNAMNRALKNEHGEVGIVIDPSCRELIADLEQVLVDGRGGIKKTGNRRDPYYRRTHISDALGYMISFESPVRSFTAGAVHRVMVRVPDPGYAV